MRVKCRRLITSVFVLALLISMIGIVGNAYAGPLAPESPAFDYWTAPTDILKTEQNEKSFVIHAATTVPAEFRPDLNTGTGDINIDISDLLGTAFTRPVSLYISFPVEGGFRLRTSEEELKSGYFNPSDVQAISYTEMPDGSLKMTGADGTTLYVTHKTGGFTLAVHDALNRPVLTLPSENIGLAYAGEKIVKCKVSLPLAADEAIYNGSERFNDFNQVGHTFSLRNVDAAYHGSTDASSNHTDSYINVPIFHSSEGYSIWYNMTYTATADIGVANPSVYSVDFDGGKLDFYVFGGTILENIQKYTSITGTSYIPPKWAFGYWFGGGVWQWRTDDHGNVIWQEDNLEQAYVEQAYHNLVSVMDKYEELGVDVAAVYCEGDNMANQAAYEFLKSRNSHLLMWYSGDDNQWNSMQEIMDNAGIARWNWPYPLWAEHPVQGDYATLHTGNNFLDFTHPNATTYLKGRWAQRLDWGLSGGMIDFGEWMPDNTYHYNGRYGDEMHNFISYDYARAYAQAFREYRGDDDFVLFERSGTAGSQKYVANFTGDQPTSWEGLKDQIHGVMSMGTAGFNIVGGDLGGYMGTCGAELYNRWVQFSAFEALMRVHSGSELRNPWNRDYPEVATASFLQYYWLRMNLQDLLYSASVDANKNATPLTQGLGVAYQGHKNVKNVNDEYLFCNSLLVAPVTTEGACSREVVLPEGNWYDFWTYEKITGNRTITAAAPTTTIPLYVKSGAAMAIELPASMQPMASMKNETKYKALLITPPDNLTNTPVYDSAEHGITYTSRYKSEYSYSLTADEASDRRMILAYGTNAAAVKVDGQPLTALAQMPNVAADEIGFFTTGDGRTYIWAPAGWSKLEISMSDVMYTPVNMTVSGDLSNMIDGDVATAYDIKDTQTSPALFTMEHPAVIDRVVIDWGTQMEQTLLNYTLEVSADKENWTQIHAPSASLGGVEVIRFEPVVAKYLRLRNADANSRYLTEIKVYEAQTAAEEVKASFNGFFGYNGLYPVNNLVYCSYDDAKAYNAQYTDEFDSYMFDRFRLIRTNKSGGYTVLNNFSGSHLYANRYLQLTAADNIWDNTLSQAIALVPVDRNGAAVKQKNFTASLAYRMENQNGGLVIAFQQDTPVGFFNGTAVNTQQAYLKFTRDDVVLYDHGTEKTLHTFSTKPGTSINQNFRVNLTVQGTQCSYSIQPEDGASEIPAVVGTLTLGQNTSGYIAIGSTGQQHGLADIKIQPLSDLDLHAGDKPTVTLSERLTSADADKGTVAVDAGVANGDGTYTYTLTVTPKTGYELKNGTLLLTDADGNQMVPMRKDFRNDTEAGNVFTVTTDRNLQVTANFYQPDKTRPNLAIIGTSTNAELAGLRFIYRLQRTVSNGKMYVQLNGKAVEIADYGVLVAIDRLVGNQRLDGNLAEKSSYIKMISVLEADRYYDYCDSHVDMSVQITGLERLPNLDVTANAYVKLADGTILYANGATSNYIAAGGTIA